jgi:hypothetical protein
VLAQLQSPAVVQQRTGPEDTDDTH